MTNPTPTVIRSGLLPGIPTGLRPDILAVARDTDWQRIGLEYMARLDELMGEGPAAIWAAPFALDDLCDAGRHGAVCYRLAMKIWDLEEQTP